MNADVTVLAALTAGLLGSGHCFGMCGGIAATLGAGAGGQAPGRAVLVVLYSVGRVGTYATAGALAGALAGLLGDAINVPGWAAGLRVLTGLLMIGIGLQIAIGWRGLARLEKIGVPLWRRLAPKVRPLLPVRSAGSALALGAIWGALPCGLVYTMLAAATLAGNPIDGALIMLAFGAGTLPAVTGMSFAGTSLRLANRSRGLRAVAGLAVVAFGIWTAALPLTGMHAGHGEHKETGHGHQHQTRL